MLKKFLSSILVLFTIVLCMNAEDVYALSSDSKWKALQPVMQKTSDGILKSVSYELLENETNGKYQVAYMTYTIPSDYKGDKVVIVPDLNEVFSIQRKLPGQNDKLYIKVVNESSHEYSYVNNSFTLSTVDFDAMYEEEYGNATSSVGFNGRNIYELFLGNRTGNKALRELYGVSSSSKLNATLLSDENLSIKLKEVVDNDGNMLYPNGVEDLNKYYLDYYNRNREVKVSKLEDLSIDEINDLFKGNCYIIPNTNGKKLKETNKEVAELINNFFYNVAFSMSFKGEVIDDSNCFDYSIGAYMRKEAVYDTVNSLFSSSFDLLNSGKSLEMNFSSLSYSGNYISNAYQSYEYGVYIDFTLERVDYEPTVTSEKIVKSSDLSLVTIGSLVEYNIRYKATVSDFMGKLDIVIIDTLPWNESIVSMPDYCVYDGKVTIKCVSSRDIASYSSNDVYEDIKLVVRYDSLPDKEVSSIVNKVSGKVVMGSYVSPSVSDKASNDIMMGRVIVHYVDRDGNKLLDDVVTSSYVSSEYTTSAMDIENYHLYSTSSNAEGVYTVEDIHVTYVYDKDGIGNDNPPHTNISNSISLINIILLAMLVISKRVLFRI